MKKTSLLTSMAALTIVAPAFATETVATFPNAALSQYMQPDTIYLNAATAENMDSVDGTAGNDRVNADPQYEQCPNGFGNTDSGATWTAQCYRDCRTSDVTNIASGASVTGKFYRGNNNGGNVNMCVPTSCAEGYINVGVDFASEFAEASAVAFAGWGQDGSYKQLERRANGTWSESGIVDGPILAKGGAFTVNNGDWSVLFGDNSSTYNRQVFGSSVCTSASDDLLDNPNPTQGNTCYCYIKGYRPTGFGFGGTEGAVYSATSFIVRLADEQTVGYSSGSENTGCAKNCAFSCAGVVAGYNWVTDVSSVSDTNFNYDFKDTLLDYASVTNKCVRNDNSITIVWSGVALGINGSVVENGQTSSIIQYGTDVQTPLQPLHQNGRVFKGWKFTKPNN